MHWSYVSFALSHLHAAFWEFIVCLTCAMQRFKVIYFFMGPWDPQDMIHMGPRALRMGPWDPQDMIHMGPRALRMGPIIDPFIHGQF